MLSSLQGYICIIRVNCVVTWTGHTVIPGLVLEYRGVVRLESDMLHLLLKGLVIYYIRQFWEFFGPLPPLPPIRNNKKMLDSPLPPAILT